MFDKQESKEIITSLIAQLILTTIIPQMAEDLAKTIEESENPEELRRPLSIALEAGESHFKQFQHEIDKHDGSPDPDCEVCIKAGRV